MQSQEQLTQLHNLLNELQKHEIIPSQFNLQEHVCCIMGEVSSIKNYDHSCQQLVEWLNRQNYCSVLLEIIEPPIFLAGFFTNK